MGVKIKKGDKVVVISGANKGLEGEVKQVFPDRDKLIVEGVNRVKRHTKPTPQNAEGGILEKEMPIHRSNVLLVDPESGKGTRLRAQIADGKKVRVAVKSGKVLDG